MPRLPVCLSDGTEIAYLTTCGGRILRSRNPARLGGV